MKTKIYSLLIFILCPLFFFAQNTNTIAGLIPDGPYYETKGSLSVSGYYKDNLKTGNWTTSFSNGQINIVESYESGKKNGIYLKINKRGYIIEQSVFVNDKLSGKKMIFSIGGNPKLVESYKDGLLDGKKTVYYDRGKKIQEESYYLAGKKNGKAKWYNSTGKLIAQYNYNIGLFDGLQLTFYSNDTIRSKQMFKNDVKVGIYYEYFENGKIKTEGSYKSGLKTGAWKVYNKEGILEKTTKYKKGVLVN